MSDVLPPAGLIGRIHHLPVRIYYEDTDFTGLVYHANYLRFFERGRSDFLRAAGIRHAALAEADTAFTVLSISVKFLKAARIDDILTVETGFDAVKGARMLIGQKLARGDDLIATAEVEVCCISMTGRAKRAPAMLVDKLKPYLEPAQSMF